MVYQVNIFCQCNDTTYGYHASCFLKFIFNISVLYLLPYLHNNGPVNISKYHIDSTVDLGDSRFQNLDLTPEFENTMDFEPLKFYGQKYGFEI